MPGRVPSRRHGLCGIKLLPGLFHQVLSKIQSLPLHTCTQGVFQGLLHPGWKQSSWSRSQSQGGGRLGLTPPGCRTVLAAWWAPHLPRFPLPCKVSPALQTRKPRHSGLSLPTAGACLFSSSLQSVASGLDEQAKFIFLAFFLRKMVS